MFSILWQYARCNIILLQWNKSDELSTKNLWKKVQTEKSAGDQRTLISKIMGWIGFNWDWSTSAYSIYPETHCTLFVSGKNLVNVKKAWLFIPHHSVIAYTLLYRSRTNTIRTYVLTYTVQEWNCYPQEPVRSWIVYFEETKRYCIMLAIQPCNPSKLPLLHETAPVQLVSTDVTLSHQRWIFILG